MENEIVNRVSNSQLITLDLEEFYTPGERVLFDMKELLFQELILRETDFRNFVKTHDWSKYQNKLVAITCSADAIVPTWAYMILASSLQPFAAAVVYGSLQDLETHLFEQKLNKIDWQRFEKAKVVVKGCSKVNVPVSVYVLAINKLRPVAQSIMYGEPCSTVPVFKKKTT
ncbi:MAG: hypothetical protein UZ12_BCD005002218 [Bacteroidetes bacterium OLB12]|nr:MAG: hypothetical protein UZ12_BCD005002218 [Bacteroidetes bacterium OLB12]